MSCDLWLFECNVMCRWVYAVWMNELETKQNAVFYYLKYCSVFY